MHNLIIAILLVGLAVGLAACYTVQGVGEDVAATGRTVQRAATAATSY